MTQKLEATTQIVETLVDVVERSLIDGDTRLDMPLSGEKGWGNPELTDR